MLDTTHVPKEAVYLLADHLDAALAAGEDLLASRLDALADLDAGDDGTEQALAQFVSRLERLEASFMGRVLQARRRLDELPGNDLELKPISALFFSSTGLLLELIGHLKQSSQQQFDVGGDRIPFLRERGLVARDAAGLPQYTAVVVTEAYRIGGIVELGPLMDLVAGLLDLLDRRYDLYGDDDFEEESDAMTRAAGDLRPESRSEVVGALSVIRDASSAEHHEARVIEDVLHGRIRTVVRRQRSVAPSTSSEMGESGDPQLTATSLMEALREMDKTDSDTEKPGSSTH